MTSPMTLNPHKIDNYVVITSVKSKPMGKLINRISDFLLLISSLPGSASRRHVEQLGKSRDSTSILKVRKMAKIRNQYNQVPHLTTKPCLVNLISKDTHLVFSILFSRVVHR